MPRKSRVTWTEEHDEAIRKAYDTERFPMKWLLAKHPLFNCGRVSLGELQYRVAALGVGAMFRRTSKELEDFVAQYAGERPVEDIAVAVNRKFKYRGAHSYSPIQIRQIMVRLGHKTAPDRLSLNELRQLFRVGPRKVRRWIREGKLSATKSTEGDTFFYRIKPIDVVLFVRQYPWELEGVKVDMPWFMALLDELWTAASFKMSGHRKRGSNGNLHEVLCDSDNGECEEQYALGRMCNKA